MKLAMIADLHIQWPVPWSQKNRALVKCKEWLLRNEIDVLCVLGDLSDHGWSTQLECASLYLNEIKQACDCTLLVTLGNHDLWHYFGSKRSVNATFQEWKEGCAMEQQHLFDEIIIEGVPFLCLNSEEHCRTSCWFSQAQLVWLKERLSAYDKDTPVFILNHQPLTYTHPHSEHFGLLQDPLIKDMLKGREQVIWCSGHIHNAPVPLHVLTHPYGIQLDVPAFRLNESGHDGCGLIVELSDAFLTVSCVDFLQDIILANYQKKMR